MDETLNFVHFGGDEFIRTQLKVPRANWANDDRIILSYDWPVTWYYDVPFGICLFILLLAIMFYSAVIMITRYEDDFSEMANQKRVFEKKRIAMLLQPFIFLVSEYVAVYLLILEYTSSARPVGSYIGLVRGVLWFILFEIVILAMIVGHFVIFKGQFHLDKFKIHFFVETIVFVILFAMSTIPR